MELSTVKHVIENNENLPSSIIFKCVDNAFIPESYIDHLKAKFKINYIQYKLLLLKILIILMQN